MHHARTGWISLENLAARAAQAKKREQVEGDQQQERLKAVLRSAAMQSRVAADGRCAGAQPGRCLLWPKPPNCSRALPFSEP